VFVDFVVLDLLALLWGLDLLVLLDLDLDLPLLFNLTGGFLCDGLGVLSESSSVVVSLFLRILCWPFGLGIGFE